MSAQEILALYRTQGKKCPFCQRIVSRYEKTLRLSREDLDHLVNCLMKD